MTFLELLILSVSLVFDTFAVCVCGGMSLPEIKLSKKASVVAFFGFLQAAYLFAGWYAGDQFASIVHGWDHWVAFAILAYLGGKMFLQGIRAGNGGAGCSGGCAQSSGADSAILDFLKFKRLFFLATATSIDAVAVGASLALVGINWIKISFAVSVTFLATALAAFAGLQGGAKLGNKIGNKAEIWGGVILMLIGMRILIVHLF